MTTFPFPRNVIQWPSIFSTIRICTLACLVSFLFQLAPISGKANPILHLVEISSELSMQVLDGQSIQGGHNEDRVDSIQQKVQPTGTEQSESSIFLYLFLLSVLIILGLSGICYHFYKKIKGEQAKLKELREQNNILSSVQETNHKELVSSSMFILKTTSLLNNVRQRLLEANLDLSKQDETKLKEIISDLKENVNSGKAWLEFDMRFQKVHQAFYADLLKICPSLSPNELKLCAFLKLNMSTKEISAITLQTVKTLTIARYRLRKKLGLKQDVNLINYLSKI